MSDAVAAADVTPKKVDWLWPPTQADGRIPKGMITVLAGKPDQGKGMVAAHIAAAVTKQDRNVLYSAVEDAADMMTRPRLESAGANLKRVLLFRFTVPEMYEEMEAHVIDNDIALVVMDPFGAHLSSGVNRGSDKIRSVLTPLSSLAEDTGCSFLVIEHALKRVAKNAHPLTAIAGSGSGLVAAARMAFVFGSDPNDGDNRVLCCVKSNIRERPKAMVFETDSQELDIVGEVPYLLEKGETEFDARRLLTSEAGEGASAVGRRPDKRAAITEWLIEYLHENGKSKVSVVIEDAKQFGFSNRTLRRAATAEIVEKGGGNSAQTRTWELTPAVKKALGLTVAAKDEAKDVGKGGKADRLRKGNKAKAAKKAGGSK